MGIDIYMSWEGQTEEEKEAQCTGFDTTAGSVGYLREAYHGGPYATIVLLPECFGPDSCEAKISAATLRSRLPVVLETAAARMKSLYGEEAVDNNHPRLRSFIAFVELAERQEAKTGKLVTIYASY